MTDKESYIILWDMLIQLLRQKGQVKGIDLAELLLKDSREGLVVESRKRASSHRKMEGGTYSCASSICHDEVHQVEVMDPVGKFRSYLLHGN